MLLQAYDFAHLYRTMGVELQMGGADQWGNITAGLELIRRTSGRGDGRRAGPRPRLQAAALAVGDEVRQERGRRVGLARPGADVARTRSTSTGCNTDDRDVGTYLRWFTEFPRERDRGARGRGRARTRGARRPARARARHHDPDPRRRGGRRGRSPIPRRSSRPGRSTIRPCSRRSTSRPAGSRSIRRGSRPGIAVAARRGRASSRRGRGAPDDRRRRRDGQRRSGSPTRTLVPEPIAGEWLDVRIGKRRREIGRGRLAAG